MTANFLAQGTPQLLCKDHIAQWSCHMPRNLAPCHTFLVGFWCKFLFFSLENMHRFLTILYLRNCHGWFDSASFQGICCWCDEWACSETCANNYITPKCIRNPEIGVTETVGDLLTDLLPTKPKTPNLHSLKLTEHPQSPKENSSFNVYLFKCCYSFRESNLVGILDTTLIQTEARNDCRVQSSPKKQPSKRRLQHHGLPLLPAEFLPANRRRWINDSFCRPYYILLIGRTIVNHIK